MQNPRFNKEAGVFNFRVTKWGLGGSGEFSCLLDYPGESLTIRPISIHMLSFHFNNNHISDSKIK